MNSQLRSGVLTQAETILADIVAQGRLLPEQENQFREDLIEESPLLRMTDVQMLRAPSKYIPYMQVDDDILSAPSTGRTNRAVTPKGVDTRGVTLETKLMRGRVEIADEVLNEVVSQGRFQDVALGLVAKKIAKQLDRFILNGDSALAAVTSANAEQQRLLAYYGLQDGIFKRAAGNGIVGPDFASGGNPADLPATCLENFLRVLPEPYQQFSDEYVLMVTTPQFNRFRSTVMHRLAADNKFEAATFGNVRAIRFPEGNVMLPLPAISQELIYTPTGGSQTTYTNRNKALFINPRHVVVGMFMGGLRMTIHYDYNEFQSVINFETYVGSNVHFTNAIIVGSGVRAT